MWREKWLEWRCLENGALTLSITSALSSGLTLQQLRPVFVVILVANTDLPNEKCWRTIIQHELLDASILVHNVCQHWLITLPGLQERSFKSNQNYRLDLDSISTLSTYKEYFNDKLSVSFPVHLV